MSDAIDELCRLIDEAGLKVVFWCCPKECNGRVTWNEDKTDATCEVCGYTRKEWIKTLPPSP